MSTRKPPTREIGTTSPSAALGMTGGLARWASFVDEAESVPELQWPSSVQAYAKMRNSGQITGILTGLTLPIRRYHWQVDPNGASDEVVERLALALGLPIKDDDRPVTRQARRTFSHDRHLKDALLALLYGHQFFEIVGEVRGDGLWHLTRLAPRLPQTISEFGLKSNGDLDYIRQNITQTGFEAKPIPEGVLAYWVWDREGANWPGRSIVRACYQSWLIKDRLMRVDAVKHERNGVGMPVVEAPPGATPTQMAELDRMAQEYKAGERGGGAIPHGSKFSLKGTEGNVPDTVASMRYHDELMSRTLLLMFMQLGTNNRGAQNLGETFVDYVALAQEVVADWYCDGMNETFIDRFVGWNWGEDEVPPSLDFIANEDPSLSVADLTAMADKGLITLDPELDKYIRQRFRLPAPANPGDDGEPDDAVEQDPAADEGTGAGVQAKAGRKRWKTSRRVAAAADINEAFLPRNVKLRRQPFDHEVRAQVDFDAIEVAVTSRTERLVQDWADIRTAQIDELVGLIESANGDLAVLSQISASPIGADTLRPVLVDALEEGIALAQAEATRQGVTLAQPALDDLATRMASIADATDQLLTRSISEAAGRQALRRTGEGSSSRQVAQEVRDHLMGLSDAYLRDQLGGTVNGALNTGRREAMASSGEGNFYASELLDGATCDLCAALDGREYANIRETEEDYPTGGYKDCLGGPRCRGTVVAVYGENEAVT